MAENSTPSPEAASNGKGFKLKISFNGLCIFVPGDEVPPHRMRVLMINACGQQQGEAMGSGMSAHFPYVRVRHENIKDLKPRLSLGPAALAKAGSQIADSYSGPAFDRWWNHHRYDAGAASYLSAVHILSWEDIVIAPGLDPGSPDLMVADGRKAGAQEPLDNTQAADFSWVAEIEKAGKGAGAIDPRCFQDDPPRNVVAGRTRLVTGTIATGSLAMVLDNYVIWDFMGAQSGVSSGYSQALASSIVYTRLIKEDYVVLRFQSMRGDSSYELSLQPFDNLGEVDVEIGNLPLSDILGLQVDDYPAESPVDHFSMLYRLSVTPPMDPAIPVAICHPPRSVGGGSLAGTLICPGGQASPHPHA
jgi:hypothetical protein